MTTFDSAAGRPREPATIRHHVEPYDRGDRGEVVEVFMQWLQACRDNLRATRPDPVKIPRQPTRYEQQRYRTRTGIVLYKQGQARPAKIPRQTVDRQGRQSLWGAV